MEDRCRRIGPELHQEASGAPAACRRAVSTPNTTATVTQTGLNGTVRLLQSQTASYFLFFCLLLQLMKMTIKLLSLILLFISCVILSLPSRANDSGLLTHKETLPVRSLVLGDVHRPGSESAYKVGHLRCHGDSKSVNVTLHVSVQDR